MSSRRMAILLAFVAGIVGIVAVIVTGKRGPATVEKGWPEWPAPVTTFVQDLGTSESTHDVVARNIKATLIKGIRTQDWALAARAFTTDFQGAMPGPSGGRLVPDHALKIRQFDDAGVPAGDAAGFVAALRDHTSGWVSVERATWRTFEFRLHPDRKRARLAAHVQIAGPLPSGGREDFQSVIEAEAVLSGEAWLLRRARLREGFRLSNPLPPFEDIAASTGFVIREPEEFGRVTGEVLQGGEVRTAGGLSCFDFNGDGFWDILVTLGNRHSTLFLNDGRGGFTRGPSPAKTPEEAAYFFLCLDLDNDGRLEAAGTQVLEYRGTTAKLGLYSWTGSEWRVVPGGLVMPNQPGLRDLLFQGIVPADVDRDGRLDLFYGGYLANMSRREKFNTIAAFDACDNQLFLNRGGLTFSEESDERGIRGTQYTFAGAFFDLDGDGDEDLYEVNDYGPNIVWLNDGKGRFSEAKGHRLVREPAYSMGVSIADWDNTGRWSVYVSAMYSHAGNRIVPLADGLEKGMRDTAVAMAIGNRLFEMDDRGAWEDFAIQAGVNFADWAWSCNFFDADNDGDRDLFVADGFKSSEDRSAPDY